MYVYHNNEVHLDLCSGHDLNTSTSAIYLLGNDLRTTFCTYLVDIIITQAHHASTCAHAHTHMHLLNLQVN